MPIPLNGTPFMSKKAGGKQIQPEHGGQGWMAGEWFVFYRNVGLVSRAEIDAARERASTEGIVFVNRSSPIPAPEVHGTVGFQKLQPRRRRVPVKFYHSAGWVHITRFEELERRDWLQSYTCCDLGHSPD